MSGGEEVNFPQAPTSFPQAPSYDLSHLWLTMATAYLYLPTGLTNDLFMRSFRTINALYVRLFGSFRVSVRAVLLPGPRPKVLSFLKPSGIGRG